MARTFINIGSTSKIRELFELGEDLGKLSAAAKNGVSIAAKSALTDSKNGIIAMANRVIGSSFSSNTAVRVKNSMYLQILDVNTSIKFGSYHPAMRFWERGRGNSGMWIYPRNGKKSLYVPVDIFSGKAKREIVGSGKNPIIGASMAELKRIRGTSKAYVTTLKKNIASHGDIIRGNRTALTVSIRGKKSKVQILKNKTFSRYRPGNGVKERMASFMETYKRQNEKYRMTIRSATVEKKKDQRILREYRKIKSKELFDIRKEMKKVKHFGLAEVGGFVHLARVRAPRRIPVLEKSIDRFNKQMEKTGIFLPFKIGRKKMKVNVGKIHFKFAGGVNNGV